MRPVFLNLLQVRSLQQAFQKRYGIAFTVTLACLMELLDASIVNVAVPHMMGTLGASLDEIVWVSTGYIIANMIVIPISGWCCDFFGRRNFFLLSISMFTVASFGCGIADSVIELVVWRIIQGLGGGGLMSTSQVILWEAFTKAHIATSTMIFGLGVMVGPMLGPALGGYLTDTFSWPWIFFINVPLGALAVLLALFYIYDSPHAAKITKIDWQGLLLLATAVGSLQLMLERGNRQEWLESDEIFFYLAAGIISLAGFVARQLRGTRPLVDLKILADRQFSAMLTINFFVGFAIFGTVFIFPLYLQTILSYTALQAGVTILLPAFASGVATALTPKFREMFPAADSRLMVFAGIGLYFWSMWEHASLTDQSTADQFMIPLLIRGVGLGIIYVPLVTLALPKIPMPKVPDAIGLYNLIRMAGGTVGIAIFVLLLHILQADARAIVTAPLDEANPHMIQRLSDIKVLVDVPDSSGIALAIFNGQISKQVAMIAFEKLFFLSGLALLLVTPLLLFAERAAPERPKGSDTK